MFLVTCLLSAVAALATLPMALPANIPMTGDMSTFSLEPGKPYEDIQLVFTSSSIRHLDTVSVNLRSRERSTREQQMRVPPREDGKDPPIRWTLCDSAFATDGDVRVTWKAGAEKDRKIKVSVQRKDTRLSDAPWDVKSALWEYRRLTWPDGASYKGVSLQSQGPLSVVACVRNQCVQDVTAPLTDTDEQNCQVFANQTQFYDVNGVFLYLKIKNIANIGDNGKSVKVTTKHGLAEDIRSWLSSVNEMKESRPSVSMAKQHTEVSSAKPEPLGGGGGGGGGGGMSTVNRISNGERMSQSISLTNSGSPSANVVYNIRGPDMIAPAIQKTETAAKTETETETPTTAADGAARLGELVSDEVTGQRPGQLQFVTAPQGGPLTFDMASDGPLTALLALESHSKSLDISSIRGGSDNLQLCQGQLKDGRLRVTVSTPSEGPVRFTARLRRSGNPLSVGKTKEVDVWSSHANVSRLDFPDYDSPVGLKVDLPRSTCLRVSLFKKACKALAGGLKDAILYKYVSNGDYLPVENPTDVSRRAFLRTELASPEQCGLPAAAGSVAGAALDSLRAMFTLDKHEDEWMVVLLPPLAMTLALPALVFYLVRAAAARWRRGPPGDDGEVIITELQETPSLPRHVPRFIDTETGKPAVTGAPAPATPGTIGLVSAATGCPGLSEEKREMAALVTQQTGDACLNGSFLYPRLSDEQLREVAEVEAEVEAEMEAEGGGVERGAKERLAARLGVGGCPAPPSAPALAPAEDVSSAALLSRGDNGRPADTAVVAGRLQLAAGHTDQRTVDRRLTPLVTSLSTTVLVLSVYFSKNALSGFFSGNVGACPVSAHYTLVSTGLPGFAGLVNLAPAAACAACLYWMGHFWRRRAAPSLRKAGCVWPAPMLGWLLMAYGIQAAIDGLCPGHNPVFTTNTFAVAFVGVVAASQVPTVCPALPLAVTAGGSVLASGAASLGALLSPAIIGPITIVVHVIGTAVLGRRLMLPSNVGHLTVRQQFRLLDLVQVAVLGVPQVLAAVLGAFVLSPSGYLALSALAVLISVLATQFRKGTVSIRTPLSPYAWLLQLVGLTTFFVAIVIGQASYYGRLGLLEASAVGELMNIVSCFALGLGISPRVERLQ